jgi:hypothetical protein
MGERHGLGDRERAMQAEGRWGGDVLCVGLHMLRWRRRGNGPRPISLRGRGRRLPPCDEEEPLRPPERDWVPL